MPASRIARELDDVDEIAVKRAGKDRREGDRRVARHVEDQAAVNSADTVGHVELAADVLARKHAKLRCRWRERRVHLLGHDRRRSCPGYANLLRTTRRRRHELCADRRSSNDEVLAVHWHQLDAVVCTGVGRRDQLAVANEDSAKDLLGRITVEAGLAGELIGGERRARRRCGWASGRQRPLVAEIHGHNALGVGDGVDVIKIAVDRDREMSLGIPDDLRTVTRISPAMANRLQPKIVVDLKPEACSRSRPRS